MFPPMEDQAPVLPRPGVFPSTGRTEEALTDVLAAWNPDFTGSRPIIPVSISYPVFSCDSLSSHDHVHVFLCFSCPGCPTLESHVSKFYYPPDTDATLVPSVCPREYLYPACIPMACHPLFAAFPCQVGGRSPQRISSSGLESRVQQRLVFQHDDGLHKVSRINKSPRSDASHLVLSCSSSCVAGRVLRLVAELLTGHCSCTVQATPQLARFPGYTCHRACSGPACSSSCGFLHWRSLRRALDRLAPLLRLFVFNVVAHPRSVDASSWHLVVPISMAVARGPLEPTTDQTQSTLAFWIPFAGQEFSSRKVVCGTSRGWSLYPRTFRHALWPDGNGDYLPHVWAKLPIRDRLIFWGSTFGSKPSQ